MCEGSESLLPQQQMSEFASVNSFRMKEDVLLISWVGERQGEVGSAIKVVMVTMTSDGAPMGVTRRFSTGEIIFVLGGRVLELCTRDHKIQEKAKYFLCKHSTPCLLLHHNFHPPYKIIMINITHPVCIIAVAKTAKFIMGRSVSHKNATSTI